MAFIADRETLFDELDDELRLAQRPAHSVATTLPEGGERCSYAAFMRKLAAPSRIHMR
jgi:hypothetical protein